MSDLYDDLFERTEDADADDAAGFQLGDDVPLHTIACVPYEDDGEVPA